MGYIWNTVPDVVEVLCEGGANVNFRHHGICFGEGDTPLHIAIHARTGYSEQSASEVRSECVKILIKHGAHVNSQNNKGQTPLHSAVCQNEVLCAGVLLLHEANRDIEDIHGKTPLVLAQETNINNNEMVALLANHQEIL
jgi:ankyrin repeat protein